jgi:hypothetical protein
MFVVKSQSTGKYYLQVEDNSSRWGFYLTDGDSAWDGGFGLGNAVYVPSKRKVKKLEAVRHAIANNYGRPDLQKYSFVYDC